MNNGTFKDIVTKDHISIKSVSLTFIVPTRFRCFICEFPPLSANSVAQTSPVAWILKPEFSASFCVLTDGGAPFR